MSLPMCLLLPGKSVILATFSRSGLITVRQTQFEVNMKQWLALTMMTGVIWATTMVAQETATVQSVQIIDYGIYRIELTGQRVPMPSAQAGRVRPASRAVLVVQTNQIPATIGTSFGCQFIVNGNPTGALAALEVVVEHPAFKKPDGETTGTTDRVPWRYTIGEKAGYTYTFDHDWEAVPGSWSIEIWQDGKKLAGKEFFVKPAGK